MSVARLAWLEHGWVVFELEKPRPVVVTQKGEEEFKVEQVVDACLKCGKLEFLVLWEGYGDKDRIREPEAHLDNSCNIVCKSYSKNPLAPRKLRGMDSNLFKILFQPIPKNLTTTSGTWSRLEVEL
ncbi:hypothetical protein SERLADRAFT_442484 [Serpula lacrymans var. lacrymans S7.9]|uniref:Chromo domain-containing protein n=1 Tax=Serpula lacrymans var. lacrymans (strain S7.9) TaxID=578457 RepID=F8P9M1_SERL9|nr:uncharacterized protein SERLADRAFT_442484 [Serpula lacrymans var. lacrymans S7.9]EGO20350.1 hypothetical protein SERLADRAFT_442484 [Serpula lacrymans var. lacrymans S7.9]